jgi:hypothetical protein
LVLDLKESILLCSQSCSYYDKEQRGDPSWNSKGAFGILENKVLVGFVVLDFFFGMEGFSTKLLFPRN